jgi:peroxiredoxin
MAQLRDEYDRFAAYGSEIIVVGPEGPAAFKAHWRKNALPFVGLPDPKHQVLKRYGQQVNLFKLGRMPAQVIVDLRGRVRFAHYGHSMMDIPANSEILDLLDKLKPLRSTDANNSGRGT